MNTESIIGMVGFGISIVGLIVAAINHTRIRSNCFGNKIELSVDIDKTNVLSSKSFELKECVLNEEIKESKETNE